MIAWSTATAEQLVREAARLGANQRLLVRAGCACARVALPFADKQDRAVCTRALDAAERWTRGEATAEECELASWEAVVAWEAAVVEWAASSSWEAAVVEWAAAMVEWAAAMVEWAARSASRNKSLVPNAARSVLTREVFATLALRHAVLGDSPSARLIAQWDESLGSHALHTTLTAWAEVYVSERGDAPAMLAQLIDGVRDLVLSMVVVV